MARPEEKFQQFCNRLYPFLYRTSLYYLVTTLKKVILLRNALPLTLDIITIILPNIEINQAIQYIYKSVFNNHHCVCIERRNLSKNKPKS